jgi:hypothetical protein
VLCGQQKGTQGQNRLCSAAAPFHAAAAQAQLHQVFARRFGHSAADGEVQGTEEAVVHPTDLWPK